MKSPNLISPALSTFIYKSNEKVVPSGIEPEPKEPESLILSIKLWDLI